MLRLRWSGSQQAVSEAEEAFRKLKPRKKPVKQALCKRKQKKYPRVRRTKSGYAKYLESDWWKVRRLEAIRKAGGCCEVCGTVLHLRVHHLRYDHLHHEPDEDLKVLCRECHTDTHIEEVIRKLV